MKKKQYTIKELKQVKPRHKDSFWFDGQVATISDGVRKISIEATGNIDVSFTDKEDKSFVNDDARKQAKKRGLTDRGLRTRINFGAFNWFTLYEIVEKDDLGKKEEEFRWIHDTVAGTYDDAIMLAKDSLKKLTA